MENKNKVNPCQRCPYKKSEYCFNCSSNPSRRTGNVNNPWMEYYLSDEERKVLKEEVKHWTEK